MKVRAYTPSDYQQLAALYKQSDQFKFDEITDAEENIQRKVEKDPHSLLVVEDTNQLLGSVSIIEDGRIALLFRLIAIPSNPHKEEILQLLVQKAEEILKERGYSEMHNTAPMNNLNALMERRKLGFTEGEVYTWFSKNLTQ